MPARPARIVLREFRLGRQMSQTEMAEAIGVKQPTYCDWENGKRIPHMHWRPSVERVTRGEVAASSWPKARRPRKANRVVREKEAP